MRRECRAPARYAIGSRAAEASPCRSPPPGSRPARRDRRPRAAPRATDAGRLPARSSAASRAAAAPAAARIPVAAGAWVAHAFFAPRAWSWTWAFSDRSRCCRRGFIGNAVADEPIDIEQDEHLLFDGGERLDEHGIDAAADVRRRLRVGRVHVVDLGHCIDDHTHRALVAGARDTHDDDDRSRSEFDRFETEPAPQVDDRHHGTAKVDHAQDIVGAMRNSRYLVPTLDLLHAQDIHAIFLAGEHEGQVLLAGFRGGFVRARFRFHRTHDSYPLKTAHFMPRAR